MLLNRLLLKMKMTGNNSLWNNFMTLMQQALKWHNIQIHCVTWSALWPPTACLLTAHLMSSCFCISSSPVVLLASHVHRSAEQPSCFQPLMKSFSQKPLKQPVFQAHQRLPWVNWGGHSQPIRVCHRTSMGVLSSLPKEWRIMPCNERTDGLLFVLWS